MVGSGLKSLYQFLKKIDSRSAWSGGDYDISINCAINPFWALSPLNRSWTVIAARKHKTQNGSCTVMGDNEKTTLINKRRGGSHEEYKVGI